MAASGSQTILLVEDYHDTREMLRLLLEALNYHILEAANGQEALDLAAKQQPDLILTDFNLPDIAGTELIRRLRALGERIPIIVLTARDRNELYDSVVAAGGSAFLTKPTDFVLLEQTISSLLDASRQLNGPVNGSSH